MPEPTIIEGHLDAVLQVRVADAKALQPEAGKGKAQKVERHAGYQEHPERHPGRQGLCRQPDGEMRWRTHRILA